MSSAFNAAAYEAATTTDSSSTSVTPIPEGEYNAIIEDYKWNSGTSKRDQSQFVSFNVIYRILDDTNEVTNLIGREPKLTQSYFVDTNPQGTFDFSKGKNVWLGKLREAVGLNAPGAQFTFSMLKGQALRIVVTQEPAKDSDDVYNRVKSVGRLAA
jgi:hypothetical protein